MKRNLFYAFFALSLMTGNAMAVETTVPTLQVVNQKDNVPYCVREFMKTPIGKKFSLEQVMSVYNSNCPVAKAESNNIISETKIDEDFSLWTKGSEDAPDETMIENADEYTKQKGWTAFRTYQAGGKAYMGYDEIGDDGPGYLMTPAVDLSDNDGVFKVTFRVKNVNPNAQDQGLQYFILNDDPVNKGMISAASLPMSTEWQDLELLVDGGVKYTSVMFLGWQGKVLVDNVKVEKLTYPLAKPKNISFYVSGGGEITAKWNGVDGATSYYVELVDRDTHQTAADVTTSETSTKIVTALDTSHEYYVRVTAVNGNDKSFPGTGYSDLVVNNVAAPIAKEATDISTSGFTANWETSKYAANYKLAFIRTHTATTNGEQVTYIDDDFSSIPYAMEDPKGTVQTPDFVTPVSLDNMFQYPGWSTLLGVGFQGFFGITNMYEAYGIPGALFGPVADFSIGEGKAKVSGVAITSMDDAQVKVGFGTLSLGKVTFNDGAQTFEVSTAGSAFDVEVSGGSKDSQLIFQIIDAAEGGDVVLFDNIKATASLKQGDTYTLPYSIVTLPYDATSYKLEVPFTGNDSFQYYLTGCFGSTVSDKSNIITVNSPESAGINAISTSDVKDATYMTLDGMRVANPAKSGIYLMKKGNKTVKILK